MHYTIFWTNIIHSFSYRFEMCIFYIFLIVEKIGQISTMQRCQIKKVLESRPFLPLRRFRRCKQMPWKDQNTRAHDILINHLINQPWTFPIIYLVYENAFLWDHNRVNTFCRLNNKVFLPLLLTGWGVIYSTFQFQIYN